MKQHTPANSSVPRDRQNSSSQHSQPSNLSNHSFDEKIESKRSSEDHNGDAIVPDVEKDPSMAGLEKISSSKYGAMRRASQDPSKIIISFAKDDPEAPDNWSSGRKIYSTCTAIITVLNSTLGSSIAAGASIPISEHFGVTNRIQLVLPTSMYLVGYVVGPMVWGPLSEQYGRKIVMVIAFFIFTVFSMAVALSPNWPALIIFRFIVGIAGACPIAVVSGICADVYHEPSLRGRAMAIFMVATCWGPVIGPIVSGFISTVSWAWPFWVSFIFAGITWPFLLMYRETYSPILLKWRAQKLRKSQSNPNIFAPIELEPDSLKTVLTVVCLRAVKMLVFEPLILFTCLYTSLIYGVFYIFFQSFPVIYSGIYGFSSGQTGLMFVPIGIGALIACPLYLWYDALLRRAQAEHKPWALNEEYRRLPLACLAGPFLVAALFWTGFTASPDINWAVPSAAGIPFGVGFVLLFMGMINYLVDAYGIYAASATAAASASRSVFGAALPFAAGPMYESLGVRWACALLGFISALMAVVPFVFLRYGGALRKRSPFCQYLLEQAKTEQDSAGDTRGKDEEAPGALKVDEQ